MKLRVLSLAITMAYLSPALAQTPAPQAPAKPDEAGAGAQKLETVVVTGSRSGPDYQVPEASSATKTATPLMETATAVQVVPRAVLDDQGAVRVDRALENVSGISLIDGQGVENSFTIRGFRTGELYRDGIRARAGRLLQGPRETSNIERIEVVKGPASVLYGRLEPGGLINLAPKLPLAEAYAVLQQQVGSEGFLRTSADLAGPLSGDGSVLYRFNAVYERADSFREFRSNRRTFVAPVLQWNMGPRTRLLLDVEHLDSRDPLDYLNPVLRDRPIDLPRERNLGEAGSLMDTKDTRATVTLAHELADEWRMTFKLDHNRLSFDIPPQVAVGGLVDPTACTSSSCEVVRFPVASDGKGSSDFASLELLGRFATGRVRHTLLLGVDHLRDRNDNTFLLGFTYNPIDMFNPVHTPVDPNILAAPDYSVVGRIRETWRGAYVQDQFTLDGSLFFTAGVRYDDTRVDRSDSESLFGGAPTATSSSVRENATTPRLGVLWRAAPGASLYANYVENFGASNGRNADGSLLPAQSAKQFELGLKTELLDRRVVGTAALFSITKRNMAIADPDPVLAAAGFQSAVGEVRHRGLELDLAGEIGRGWRIITNYAFIDSEITRDAVESGGAVLPGNTGNRLAAVPKHAGSLWSTYELPSGSLAGWTFGAGFVARSARPGDNANTFTLPGYAVANLMARYRFGLAGKAASLQVNLDNVFDRTYHTTAGSRDSGVGFGSPRSIVATLRVNL